MDDLRALDDRQLIGSLEDLVARSRRIGAGLIAHLAEMERRKLYLELGYPSLYAFCLEALRLSEDVAAKRLRAARVVREHPLALEMLADGRVHVSALVQLAPRLTPGDARELLEAASGKSCAEVRQLLAERFPAVDVPTSVRRKAPVQRDAPAAALALPDSKRVAGPPAETGKATGSPSAPLQGGQGLELTAPPDRGRVEPLSRERYAVRFTASASLVGKLEELQAVLAHTVRGGDLGQMLELAVDALLDQRRKRRFGTTDGPRELAADGPGPQPLPVTAPPEAPEAETASTGPATPARGPERSRHVPMAIRRAVYERDGARCAYVGSDGRRCGAQDVELDHVHPYARGGRHTVAGLRLLCRRHNQHAARKAFGDHAVEASIARARRARESAPAQGTLRLGHSPGLGGPPSTRPPT